LKPKARGRYYEVEGIAIRYVIGRDAESGESALKAEISALRAELRRRYP
jgi:hypothetical protein